MTQSAFITGCQGLVLSANERQFLRDSDPWGFILFGRNIDSPDQVRALVSAMRDCVGREDAPVLIDQEGGRVQRLRPPHWASYPAAAYYGQLEEQSAGEGRKVARIGARLMACDLLALGITVDCLPVLDVPVENTTKAIGDRAYGTTPDGVAALGRAVADSMLSGGVLPVIKHIPGHGRAVVDSHFELPRVSSSLVDLLAHDFAAFKPLADFPLGMTAHVVFEAIDPDNPATLSSTVISTIIRDEIGFHGLLMSDDISMGALQTDMADRTSSAIRAGCDMVLHCNGLMDEMQSVAANVPKLDGVALERANKALNAKPEPDGIDLDELRKEFSALLSLVDWEA
ncbi:beta-N-acetylhexosaminidase [Pararhizobium sp. IMCC21322]|uniref:beta-N-acetylhexosaminidase n=1 Tax=Pararhizobium sp. IMCC21322 TaxID=3067903 RepID=UPI0027424F97|nr:beta-N-acetylhexosaminidase [Pararhizobium sp. IMCC21322]